MSKYGPYDEEATYPHDYFEQQKGSRYPEGHYQGQRYHDGYHQGSKYTNDHREDQRDHYKGWVQPDPYHGDDNSEAQGREYRRYFVFKEGQVHENHAKMQKSMKTQHVWKPKELPGVPAVTQPKQKSEKENRDLRPAVFIKDLNKRSKIVEEEKAQLRKK